MASTVFLASTLTINQLNWDVSLVFLWKAGQPIADIGIAVLCNTVSFAYLWVRSVRLVVSIGL